MSVSLSLFSQCWRERRESYRPAGEPINPRLNKVAELAADLEAKEFILAHHYRCTDSSGCDKRRCGCAGSEIVPESF